MNGQARGAPSLNAENGTQSLVSSKYKGFTYILALPSSISVCLQWENIRLSWERTSHRKKQESFLQREVPDAERDGAMDSVRGAELWEACRPRRRVRAVHHGEGEAVWCGG